MHLKKAFCLMLVYILGGEGTKNNNSETDRVKTLSHRENYRRPTQSVWYEVEEGVTQQSTRGKTEQHLEQVLVLVAVGLNWDQKQDEERSCTDQQSRPDSLRTGMEGSLLFICVSWGGQVLERKRGKAQ